MNKDQFITKTIEQARKKWGLDSQWVFTWEYKDLGGPGCATIEPDYFTEKHALVSVDPQTEDRARLRRDLFHELGHAVIYNVWRGASDWADHTIKSKKARDIWNEMINTNENVVIDHIVCQIFKI
jgi:hypothetical protein